ncbi:hypothetical protein Tco_0569244 [Tanacetum coccineum]
MNGRSLHKASFVEASCFPSPDKTEVGLTGALCCIEHEEEDWVRSPDMIGPGSSKAESPKIRRKERSISGHALVHMGFVLKSMYNGIIFGVKAVGHTFCPKKKGAYGEISALSEQLQQECDSFVQQRHSDEEFSEQSSRWVLLRRWLDGLPYNLDLFLEAYDGKANGKRTLSLSSTEMKENEDSLRGKEKVKRVRIQRKELKKRKKVEKRRTEKKGIRKKRTIENEMRKGRTERYRIGMKRSTNRKRIRKGKERKEDREVEKNEIKKSSRENRIEEDREKRRVEQNL